MRLVWAAIRPLKCSLANHNEPVLMAISAAFWVISALFATTLINSCFVMLMVLILLFGFRWNKMAVDS
jgi:hypothetical protein